MAKNKIFHDLIIQQIDKKYSGFFAFYQFDEPKVLVEFYWIKRINSL